MARAEIFQNLAHYLIGFALVVKGWSKLEHFRDQPLRVGFIFLAGLLIILGTILHHRIEKKIKSFTALIYVMEGLALIVAATILFEQGKSRIPYFLFFIGVIYLIIGAGQFLIRGKNRQQAWRRLKFILGITYLAAAAVTLAWFLFWDHNFWLVVMAVVLAGAGLFILLVKKAFSPPAAKGAAPDSRD